MAEIRDGISSYPFFDLYPLHTVLKWDELIL
jgi:hypothetical protein